MPPNETNEGKLDELVRKRRGGKGKGRLSRYIKVKIILTKLHDEIQMTSDTAYHPGHYMGEIIRFFPSPNWRDMPDLMEELQKSGVIISREGRQDERGEYYYYRTEKARETLEDIEKMKELRKRHSFL